MRGNRSLERGVRWRLALAAGVAACLECAAGAQRSGEVGPSASPALSTVTFHIDAQRTGWNAAERELTPAAVAGGDFGPLWSSPAFDAVTIGVAQYAPRMYASPLYVDDVPMTAGPAAGRRARVVVAATSNGFVYAVNAFANATGGPPLPPGANLWSARLGTPSRGVDGGVPIGVLSTPTIDVHARPPRVYVAAETTEDGRSWKVFALDLTRGSVLPGWPLVISDRTLAPITVNGPATFASPEAAFQRGALNLSPDGRLLYVPFSASGGTGWMVAVDTTAPRLASAFAGAPSGARSVTNAGMWGSGGAAVDHAGRVYATTGNGPPDVRDVSGFWAESLLVWRPGAPLELVGTYTPWNYCQMDDADTDLGGDSPMILPDLAVSATRTPRLVTFGSKQGTAYLVDRDALPGSVVRRPPCNWTDPTRDRSLLGAARQPPFDTAAPLSVFGPYSERYTRGDYAKARTTPALFQAADGTTYVFYAGATKRCESCREPVPPGLARLKVVLSPGTAASLTLDATDSTLALLSPGSPVVSSHGGHGPVVWVLDANVYRSAPLVGDRVPAPILYAIDGTTMRRLWTSTPSQLTAGGKYTTVAIARGVVFVGTDRIHAFGVRGTR